MSDNEFINKNEFTPENIRFQGLHVQLQDLLAGYVDGELTSHRVDIIEAHLAGCAACRADLERQQIISQHLHKLNVAPMSVELDKRINKALEVQADKDAATKMSMWRSLKTIWAVCTNVVCAKQTGWVMAAIMVMIFMHPHIKSSGISKIPMIEDAVSEYHRIENSDLPALSVNNKIIMPVNISGSQLLATWTTKIGGESAQAFAVKVGHSVIIQYRISQNIFFRNASVRKAISVSGNFRTKQDKLEILAIPINQAGLIVVGPLNAMSETKEFSTKS
jgi:hypothetical protein